MTPPSSPPALLTRFARAVRDLGETAIALPDENVDTDLRTWLDGDDEPLNWQHSSGVTPDEYFFITTLYGNMNSGGQRTMIRKFFGPLFLRAAKGDIRNFRPEMTGYAGLRSQWMKDRLCMMGEVLRSRGISMAQYVDELRDLERHATPDKPTPALDRIVQDHGATGVKTLSVFVRDCVGGNSFPIDLRVRRQLEKYQLPLNEKTLVRLSLALKRNPRELARLFYEAEANETPFLDLIDLNASDPCVFYTWESEGWLRDPSRPPIRGQNDLTFDVFDSDTDEWEPYKMTIGSDGLYHWRDPEEPHGHWSGFFSETETHTYLAGNYVNPDGHQGVQIFVWPKS